MVAVVFAAIAFLVALTLSGRDTSASERTPSTSVTPVVFVAAARGTIDLGLAPFVDRVIDEAERERAAAVVLDIDTLGGRLDAAVAIRDRLLESQVRTVAYVHPRAISAGALVSLAASTIATSGGATIGAATPVQMQPGGTASAVDEKTVSYVRKEFRATAERRGRPAELAEAMVDADVDIAVLAPRGKLLTLTGDEALALGVADLRADDLPALLRGLGLEDAELRTRAPNWAERAVSHITAPLVSSILMTLGMIGLLVEIRTPGFGVPGLVGIVCLGLLFGGHWIVHLAGFEELLLIGVGLALLALEVLVIPGFGLAGVAGIAALVAGLGLTLIGSGATMEAVAASLGRVAISFIAAIATAAALFAALPHVPIARRIVLSARGAPAAPAGWAVDRARSSWVGVTGAAVTPLRPSGTALLERERVDVVAEGEFVPRGAAIEVVKHEGNRVVVRPVGATRGGPARASES